MKGRTSWLILAIAVALLLLSSAVYTVNMTQSAVVLEFGKPVRIVDRPGLYFKAPFAQDVRYFDNRLQTFSVQPEQFLTAGKKPVLVSFFAEWRIINPLAFYTAVRDVSGAQTRIGDIIRSGLRGEVGKLQLEQVVQGGQEELASPVLASANDRLKTLGIQLMDVRILRVGLPPEVLQTVYKRMEAERQQEANEYRSRGVEAADQIRSAADQEKSVILAQAYRKAQEEKGLGDAEAARIAAQAYAKNPAFFSFYRSLEAYRHSLGQKDVLVLDPHSPFLKYFQQPMQP